MSAAFLNIGGALDARLANMANLPSVAWQNLGFDPDLNALYLRPTHLPAPTVQAALGTSGLDRYQGVYQIDVFALSGTGRGSSEVQADLIADHFKRGTDLSYSGIIVRTGDVSRGAGRSEENRFVISIFINYLAYVAPR
jgi:hypothetical protein